MDISAVLPPSLLAERLEQLAYLYRRSDDAVAEFAGASGVSCAQGCGSCCEGFVPDIMAVEAAYVAAFLALTDRKKADSIALRGLSAITGDDGRTGCPLYAGDTPYHCTVYEARPLICRMFAFSAVRDKRGEATFSVCRLGSSSRGARSAIGDGFIEAFGAAPPVMADMGSELVAIDPSTAGERKPLPEALVAAMGSVLFLVGMKDVERDSSPPVHNAS